MVLKYIKVSLFVLPVFFFLCGTAFGGTFSATKRTNSTYNKIGPQLQVVGSKVYYVWHESDDGSKYQIWTAKMNTNGTGWSATKRTTSTTDKLAPQLQVFDSKIYYVWYEDDDSTCQIWTGVMNTDGTGWAATKRTTSAFDKGSPQLQVVGRKIHYIWDENDGANQQIWTAVEILPSPDGMLLLLLGD